MSKRSLDDCLDEFDNGEPRRTDGQDAVQCTQEPRRIDGQQLMQCWMQQWMQHAYLMQYAYLSAPFFNPGAAQPSPPHPGARSHGQQRVAAQVQVQPRQNPRPSQTGGCLLLPLRRAFR